MNKTAEETLEEETREFNNIVPFRKSLSNIYDSNDWLKDIPKNTIFLCYNTLANKAILKEFILIEHVQASSKLLYTRLKDIRTDSYDWYLNVPFCNIHTYVDTIGVVDD